MIINRHNLDALHQGFSKAFKGAWAGAETQFANVAMTVPSSTGENIYAWLGQFPGLREWIGARRIKGLVAEGYTISNKLYESTIAVQRTAIEDDSYGVYGPLMEEMGRAAAENPDKLIFELIGQGFTTVGYDGQNFFDDSHPVDPSDSESPVVSNMQAGAGPTWYLLDTSRPLKPFIYQDRIRADLTVMDDDRDGEVFWRDQYVYGVRARGAAGFGLWQLAFASKAALNAENYAAARKAMMELKGEEDRPLGLRPTTLLAPPALEEDALQLLNADRTADDASNVWKGTAKLILTPWLT